MKKIISMLLCLLMLLSCFAVQGFAAEKKNGELSLADAVIAVSPVASDTELYAAETLERYLEQITGNSFDIVNTDENVDSIKIVVGLAVNLGVEVDGEMNGSYVIKSTADTLTIAGVGSRGTIYGVYAFLEDYCGCKWFESDVIVVPENEALSVPDDINDSYEPYFEYTETDTASSRDVEFSLANSLNSGAYRTLTDEQGGTVDYLGSFCHTLTQTICSAEEYFSEHPEYFALHDGVRTPNQLCLTNPDTIDIVVNDVIELLAKEYDPDAELQIVSLTQHDNSDYCECEKCAAIDEENGSHSGTMITFVNTVAERVKATGLYDNVSFDTFAYQYTRQAPTKVVPRDDVIVRLCSIECCFGHTLDDPDCEENVAFMEDLRAWGEICDRIYVWDYVNNYSETVCIFPNFGVLQRNVQIFAENNVKGLYEEGNYYISKCDGEFDEMRTYLLSKLMQDPYVDYYAEMDAYLEAVYGAGWQYIREFIDITTEHAATKFTHLGIYQRANKTMYFMTSYDVERCDALWQAATDAAQTLEQLERVERSQLCWRYWKCSNWRGEFSRLQSPYLWMTAQDELYNDIVDKGISVLGETTRKRELSECEMLHYFRIPFAWTTLYDEDIWFFLSPYFEKLYDCLGYIHNALT